MSPRSLAPRYISGGRNTSRHHRPGSFCSSSPVNSSSERHQMCGLDDTNQLCSALLTAWRHCAADTNGFIEDHPSRPWAGFGKV
ncbi:hypothetical protein M404DRAFT_36053 [Pisolithus tinctorius Marx 270]|uniref:Uncharacterized protein n=1 Tax=Pisolithus tinctorius Marx 270 TaxID=870435 RepID=A0A0C3MX65_PISTI|nr:hypothetical protein M404DRAFT_36053 [Pisolithus tinctorius Marx 270]